MEEAALTLIEEALRHPLALRILLASGVGLLLCAGGSLFTTRWGESHTMLKCGILSVIGHGLLLAWFNVTEIEKPFGYGDGLDGPMIQVSVDTSEGESSESPVPPAPINEPPPEQVVTTPPPEPKPEEKKEEPKIAETKPAEPKLEPPAPPEAPEEIAPAEATAESPQPAAPMPMVAESKPVPAASPLPTPPIQPEESPARPAHVVPAIPATNLVDRNPARTMVAATPTATAIQGKVHVPEVYQGRLNEEQKSELVRRGGGDETTEAAVEAALAWLAKAQSADGRWNPALHGGGREERAQGQDRGGVGADADTGMTALAILALQGAGNTHQRGPYRENVQRGLEYLLRAQGRDGSLAGGASHFAAMYCHGMATLALSEAYALTSDARIRPFLERALAYTLAAQHPSQGGWRYKPGDLGDMSQFGWQALALRSAESAGIRIPEKNRQGMQKFLGLVSSGTHRGLACYRPEEAVSPTMTAEALTCRFFLGHRRDDASVNEAAQYLLRHLPSRNEQPNFYYWYYGTLAMYQVQGEPWKEWNAAIRRELLSTQIREGSHAGTWPTDSMWAGYGGRVFTTSLGALCLETYYRFLPLDEIAPGDSPEKVASPMNPGWRPAVPWRR